MDERIPGFPGLTVERGVPCVMRDGTTLLTDLYRPDGEGPWPVLLMRTPYDRTSGMNATYSHPAWYAQRGYIVACQDVRGRYGSEGEFYPFRNETDDGVDAIAWAAQLPGADGQVAMYGFSYVGATQLLPASQRPPALAAISPAMTGSQYYDGWTYNGGALALGFVGSWALSLGGNGAKRRGDLTAMTGYNAAFAAALQVAWTLPLSAYGPLPGQDTGYFADWLAHPTNDDYWTQWSIERDYSRFTTPALHVAGWYDVFLDGTIRNFNGMRAGAGSDRARSMQKLVIGPWFHIPWKPLAGAHGDRASASLVDDWQVAFYDHVLKGQDRGFFEAPVTAFIQGENQWRDFDAWPPSGSKPVEFYLHSGGRANSRYGDGVLSRQHPDDEPADIFTYDPAVPTISQGGHSCCFPHVAPMGPADQEPLESWNSVLVYTSDLLAEDLLLAGEVEVILHAATDAADTDWTARLSMVDQGGKSTNIQEGIIRARYRESLTSPTPITQGQVHEYRIRLGAVGIMLPAGYRLRVVIASSDFPHWDRNMNTGGSVGTETLLDAVVATQTVLHDRTHPSRVILPVLQGL